MEHRVLELSVTSCAPLCLCTNSEQEADQPGGTGMKHYLRLFAFVLALSTSYMLAQAGSAGAGTQANPGQSGASSQTGSMSGQDTSMQQSASGKTVDDDSLHRQVHEQLATNPDLQNVQISVRNGVVELNGTVPNKNDKKEAKRLTKAVPGVKQVKEKLSVSSSGGSSGASSSTMGGVSTTPGITGSVTAGKQNTAGSSQTAPSSTTGTTTGAQTGTQPPATSGGVTGANPPSQAGQTGTAPSSSSVGAPAGQAGATAGTPGASTASAGNDEIRNDIQTAFRNEPTLTSANVSVSVTDDTVTLNGTVPSGHDRETAERIARSFAGNRRVMDNITVAGGGPLSNTPSQTTTPEGSSVPREQQQQQQQQNTQQNPQQPPVPKL